jgi:DNA-binding NarL/FixJ family response regulator
MNKIKVILVDDHQLVRDGIKSLISNSFGIEIVGEASSAAELFQQMKEVMPDVILMDISLPNMSGIEITRVLKKDHPQIKVLILSMYTSEDFVFNAFKAGISGYLPKNTTRDELLKAIESVHNGDEYFSKSISDIILKSFVNSAKYGNHISGDKLELLTKRESEILKLVVEGYSNQQIADQLCISIRTMETHKTSILKKLNLNNTVDLVKFAIKNKIIEI